MDRMSRKGSLLAAVVLLTAISLAVFVAPSPCYAFEATIDVAPNVLNLESQGVVVTVHTDIPYGEVEVTSVYLNGVLIQSWKADDRGNFVAKFAMDDIKQLDGLVIGGYNTLKLVGLTIYNEPFYGIQQIKVIQIIPQGK